VESVDKSGGDPCNAAGGGGRATEPQQASRLASQSSGVPSLNFLVAQQSQGSTLLPSSLTDQGSGDPSQNLLASQQNGWSTQYEYDKTGFGQGLGKGGACEELGVDDWEEPCEVLGS